MREQNRDGYDDFMSVLKAVDAETVAADAGGDGEWAARRAVILARGELQKAVGEEKVSDDGARPLGSSASSASLDGTDPFVDGTAGRLVSLAFAALGAMAATGADVVWVRIAGVTLVLLAFLGSELLRLYRQSRAGRPERRAKENSGIAASAATAVVVSTVVAVVPAILH
ncbi:hypothetical protein ACFWAT_06240 [Streptomyces syringium]|uniref:hypothetical protein n=1 Tax=Streptomyces syringium TaxID=76729 RepID=UPI003666CDB0